MDLQLCNVFTLLVTTLTCYLEPIQKLINCLLLRGSKALRGINL